MTNIAKVKKVLEGKLAELRARAAAVENRLAQPGDADWEEHAAIAKNEEVLTRIDEATLAEIHEVSLALSRIETGQYGLCTTCGKAIAPERMQALPYATECVSCASRTAR